MQKEHVKDRANVRGMREASKELSIEAEKLRELVTDADLREITGKLHNHSINLGCAVLHVRCCQQSIKINWWARAQRATVAQLCSTPCRLGSRAAKINWSRLERWAVVLEYSTWTGWNFTVEAGSYCRRDGRNAIRWSSVANSCWRRSKPDFPKGGSCKWITINSSTKQKTISSASSR